MNVSICTCRNGSAAMDWSALAIELLPTLPTPLRTTILALVIMVPALDAPGEQLVRRCPAISYDADSLPCQLAHGELKLRCNVIASEERSSDGAVEPGPLFRET